MWAGITPQLVSHHIPPNRSLITDVQECKRGPGKGCSHLMMYLCGFSGRVCSNLMKYLCGFSILGLAELYFLVPLFNHFFPLYFIKTMFTLDGRW